LRVVYYTLQRITFDLEVVCLLHVGRLYTYTIIIKFGGQRAHLRQRCLTRLDVIELVDDHLVRRDGGVRFGNCLFGHLEGFVGGEGLDGVD
jgi:hypothetical protein